MNTVLIEGCSGVDVMTLQKLLGIAVDNEFGPETKKAVIEFQKKNGLEPDGIVGPITWSKLHPTYVKNNIERSARYQAGPLAEAAIDVALSFEGLKESPGNRGKLVDEWNLALDVPVGSPWCMSFVQQAWARAALGAGKPNPLQKYRTASCFDLWLSVPHTWRIKPANGERGDIVIYEFSHTGIVLRANGDGTYRTIEGNTNAAGKREGEFVMQKDRKWSCIAGFVRVPEIQKEAVA